jgi:hypothetical protein
MMPDMGAIRAAFSIEAEHSTGLVHYGSRLENYTGKWDKVVVLPVAAGPGRGGKALLPHEQQ